MSLERDLWGRGFELVVGVDEVGKGAWAGPLTVGAAVIPRGRRLEGVRDSKQLTERAREDLFEPLTRWCTAWAVGHATNHECDELGMSQAQRIAAGRALNELGLDPDWVLVDGRWNFVDLDNAETVVKGDTQSLSIAAASVLAKVSRDRIMRELAADHPEFVFERNKGYPSPAHQSALKEHGPTPLHRVSWKFMENLGLRLRSEDAELSTPPDLGAGRLELDFVGGPPEPGVVRDR